MVQRPTMGILSSQKPASVIFCVLLCISAGALISNRVLNFSTSLSRCLVRRQPITALIQPLLNASKSALPRIEIPLNCTLVKNQTRTCPRNYPTSYLTDDDADPASPSCPEYYRWVHEDLRPWKETGITEEMLGQGRRTADFRLRIVAGRLYVERYRRAFQTRDIFTIWGFLQLLRRYPGQVPDLDLIFNCGDLPVVFKSFYQEHNETVPPPLFKYCSSDQNLDIVFPDWSFWGWAEINIKPWNSLLKELDEGNKKIKWIDREPKAYWKGNPRVSNSRMDLFKCNVSEGQDWNARLYAQDWLKEIREGFKESNLADACRHRYKIYVEGRSWSVSGKYILACDSVTLAVTTHYYDFFTRGLMPLDHYWPINENSKCKSIKFAVDWGNAHTTEAQNIGRSSSILIQEELKMDNVYDYMFHLLKEYAKLLKFKPTVPQNAVEYCSETMACEAQGLVKSFMMDSLEKGPSTIKPCAMPPPNRSQPLSAIREKQAAALRQVDMWEKNP